MSIKNSLRYLLIIASILPVIIVTIIFNYFIQNRILDVQMKNLQKLTVANSNVLESMVEKLVSEILVLANQEEVVSYLKDSKKNETVTSHNELSIFTRIENYCSDCILMTLYDTNGVVIASSNSELLSSTLYENSYFHGSTSPFNISIGKSGLHRLSIGDTEYKVFEIFLPVFGNSQDNEIIGYMSNAISISYFNNFLSSLKLGETGYSILLNQDNTILYHPNQNRIGTIVTDEKLLQLKNNYQLGNSTATDTFLSQSDTSAYAYTILPELDWIFFVKQNTSELKSVTTILFPILILSCAILLITIIIFVHFITTTITDPILALRDTMRTASLGDLTVQSNIKCKNELGELSKNFNKMLHIIKTNYEDLSSMHEKLLTNEEQLRTNYDHIEYLAYHDTLTNLPNKMAFLDYVDITLSSQHNQSGIHGVFFVDLDNFKTVNDTLGHEHGDTLLVRTAQLLASLMTGHGMLARAGGDEFLILIENLNDITEATRFAQKILDSFRHPIDLNGEIVYISMSIGIAIYPENGLNSDLLIKYADIAMYKSKDNGKNNYTLFDTKMAQQLQRNTLITEVLRNAIINNEIYIQYQPQFAIDTNQIVGYEALMRIRSSKLGFISPDEFIPIAEENGLIIELSSWLLRETCLFNKKLIDLGISPRPVSVNISSIQINRPGFPLLLSEVLQETKLPPQYLELEITESTLVTSSLDTTSLLFSLQEIGVKISLDDFGTGYSALNYLTRMPINTLKIDKSFIDHICISEKDANIAQSIISLAHSLAISVVAEGVESKEQLHLLRTMGCDIVQGYVYSQPLHPHDLIDVIQYT